MGQQASGAAAQGTGDRPEPDARAALELWIILSKEPWASVVLVPADPDASTTALAKTLADVGQRLSFVPVTAITLHSLEYGSALALADLQHHLERERARSSVIDIARAAAAAPTQPGMPSQPAGAPGGQPAAHAAEAGAGAQPSHGAGPPPPAPEPQGSPPPPGAEDPGDALAVPPAARLVISIPSVVTEPLGLAATQHADAVVVTVRMGRTKTRDLRRTIELIGADQVTGCVLVD